MAVPKKRTAKSKRNHRRSHHGVARMQLVTDPDTGELMPAHTASPHTGKYKGRVVIDTLKKVQKKAQKAKEAHSHS